MTAIYGYRLYGERYAGNHDRYLGQLLESQWYSQENIDKLVEKKFNYIFRYAIDNVPYYRELVKKGAINPSDIKGIEDIHKLPILTKEEIRNNPEHFVSDKFKKEKLITINTSGTTGKTLKIYVDKDSRRYGYAFFSRFKNWLGVNESHKNITFAGRGIVSPDDSSPPFWRINPAWNNYLFSSYHLSPHNMKYYVEKMKKIQPCYIDSYPSSIFVIAKYMKEKGISGIYPKAIITSSETLFDYQRKIISEIFNCPIYDQYGCAEQVVFVSQCEKGKYHVHPEFGIVEYLKEDGSKAKEGEPARLICTGFTNLAMPLIRYDIGDTGIMSKNKCSCGRSFPVIEKIIGRTDDILVMGDGRQVGRLDPVFKGLKTIQEAQIIQENYDKVTLRIVPGNDYKESDSYGVVRELKKRLGEQTEITVAIVSKIPRSENGKFRAVISKVNKNIC